MYKSPSLRRAGLNIVGRRFMTSPMHAILTLSIGVIVPGSLRNIARREFPSHLCNDRIVGSFVFTVKNVILFLAEQGKQATSSTNIALFISLPLRALNRHDDRVKLCILRRGDLVFFNEVSLCLYARKYATLEEH